MDNLIHIANKKKKFGWSEGLNGKGEIGGCFSVKKCFRTDWKGRKMLGRRWKCLQEEAVFEREFEV